MALTEYTCCECGHDFPWRDDCRVGAHCPRCGGSDLKVNPWLLLTPYTEGLTEEDHYESLLAV